MPGCKELDGYILDEELMPVLDKFMGDESLLLASREWKVAREGLDRESIRPGTDIAIYPAIAAVTPQNRFG